ncbi:MAG: Beta-carotene ketolase, partial [uncultured Thermomicrobiales bacterium]
PAQQRRRADQAEPALLRPLPGRRGRHRLLGGHGRPRQRDRPLLAGRRPRLPPLRRDDRARLRDHGPVHPAAAADLRRVRRGVRPTRRRPRLQVLRPRLGRRLRRVLLRVGHHAGRLLRPRPDRHLPRPAGRRHRLRQALPRDGDGDRQARRLGLPPRGDGKLHPGPETGRPRPRRRHPPRHGGRPDLHRRRPGHRRRDEGRRGVPRPDRPLQRRPEADLPEAGRPPGPAVGVRRRHPQHPDDLAGGQDQLRLRPPAGVQGARQARLRVRPGGRRPHRPHDRVPPARLRGRPPGPPGRLALLVDPRPERGRPHPGARRQAHDQHLHPVLPLRAGGGDLGRAARRDRPAHLRALRPLRAEHGRGRDHGPGAGAAGRGGPLRADRRPHLPGRAGAGAGVRPPPGPRLLVVRRPDPRPVPVRQRRLAGRLRDGRPRPQRRPRGDRAADGGGVQL